MFSRIWLASLAGLLLAAAFPRVNLAGAAWIAPGLLLAATAGLPRGVFAVAFAGGLVHFLASLHWLLFIPFPAGAIAGWIALSVYCALYPACWTWLLWRSLPSIAGNDGAPPTLIEAARRFTAVPLPRRVLWIGFAGALWVALEFMRGRFLTGFPWNFTGVTQYNLLPLIQIASVTGVHGVSFLIAWFSVGLWAAVATLVTSPKGHGRWLGDLALPLLAVVLVFVWGANRIQKAPQGTETIRISLIQPSIPQTLIFDPTENTNRFNQLIALTEEALATNPQLVIWPEAAVPNFLRYDPATYHSLSNLVTRHDVWMILGADDVEFDRGDRPEDYRYFNSSFLLTPEGLIKASYQKRRLVIFGEYVPLSRVLPFLRYFTPIEGGFTPGKGPVPFHIEELGVTTSVLICFEDVFPHLSRQAVTPETDFLVNLTNNGWFGESAAQWQHAAAAVFRAVENGVPLVRCSNNGLTCWIDPGGALHEVGFGDDRDVYARGFKTFELPVGTRRGIYSSTLYLRHGDWFPWLCAAIAIAGLAAWRPFRRSTARIRQETPAAAETDR